MRSASCSECSAPQPQSPPTTPTTATSPASEQTVTGRFLSHPRQVFPRRDDAGRGLSRPVHLLVQYIAIHPARHLQGPHELHHAHRLLRRLARVAVHVQRLRAAVLCVGAVRACGWSDSCTHVPACRRVALRTCPRATAPQGMPSMASKSRVPLRCATRNGRPRHARSASRCRVRRSVGRQFHPLPIHRLSLAHPFAPTACLPAGLPV